jgi:5'-3' exonuclease
MKVLLIDGTNVVMRYAFAMVPHMMDPGYPGGHLDAEDVAKVMRAVEKACRECAMEAEATHMIVALDSGLPGDRHARFPDYKAKRIHTTNLWSNRLSIHCAARGIMALRWPQFEADDVIATLVARIGRAGGTCAVLSGDSDLLQLASLWCDVFQFGGKQEPRFVARSMKWIAEKYELPHSNMLTLYKALVGETGDGIPGVKGIGRKKAAALLQQYHSAEELRTCGKIDLEQFDLMLYLVTLREDVPLDPVQPKDCRITPPKETATHE